jgi:hypothetical protein
MRPAPAPQAQPAQETAADTECWREAARLRREHRDWIVIWLARDNCYRAYRRTPGARHDTALSAPTARDMAKQISLADKTAAGRAAPPWTGHERSRS